MSRQRVLLVEDSQETQIVVKATLAKNCDLTCVGTIAEAEQAVRTNDFQLFILDVVLPDGDGFEFCSKLRQQARFETTPIIFLTGQKDIEDRVKAFTLGGDDYVVKPLEPKEFAARVERKIKRYRTQKTQTSFQLAEFAVDWKTQKAFLVAEGGAKEDLKLTPIEFKLFVHFLRNEETVFSREELVAAIWGESVHISAHTVDTHISSLRKKIGPAAKYLRSVVKKGYCFSLSIESD